MIPPFRSIQSTSYAYYYYAMYTRTETITLQLRQNRYKEATERKCDRKKDKVSLLLSMLFMVQKEMLCNVSRKKAWVKNHNVRRKYITVFEHFGASGPNHIDLTCASIHWSG